MQEKLPNLIETFKIKQNLFGEYHYTIILTFFLLILFCLYIKYLDKLSNL